MQSELVAAEAALQASIARQNELALELDAASEALARARRTQAESPSATHLKSIATIRDTIETLEGQIELATEAINEARAGVVTAKAAQDAAELAALTETEDKLQAHLDALVNEAVVGLKRVVAVKAAHDLLLSQLNANVARQRALGANIETPDPKQFSRQFALKAQTALGVDAQAAAQTCLAYFGQLI